MQIYNKYKYEVNNLYRKNNDLNNIFKNYGIMTIIKNIPSKLFLLFL